LRQVTAPRTVRLSQQSGARVPTRGQETWLDLHGGVFTFGSAGSFGSEIGNEARIAPNPAGSARSRRLSPSTPKALSTLVEPAASWWSAKGGVPNATVPQGVPSPVDPSSPGSAGQAPVPPHHDTPLCQEGLGSPQWVAVARPTRLPSMGILRCRSWTTSRSQTLRRQSPLRLDGSVAVLRRRRR
jgi:hypothetical protein